MSRLPDYLASLQASLLRLSNPLNITLLASQLLSAPAIWQRPDGLRTTIRVLSIFNSACVRYLQEDSQPVRPGEFRPQSTLKLEEWATAVIKGADSNAPRWRHLCLLAGLLIGLEGRGERHMSGSLRRTLGNAMIKAANLALSEGEAENEFAANSIAVLVSHVQDLLNGREKSSLNSDLLLPVLIHAAFYSKEGLHSGYFLSTIDVDVVQQGRSKFEWSPKSSTFVQCQRAYTGPLMSSFGSLSRLIATSAENVQRADLLATMMTELSAFTRSLCLQWRQNKLSEIDLTEEQTFLGDETLRMTLPLLWRTLRSGMFAVVVILRSVLGRVLGDPRMPADNALLMAMQTLHILRDLYFISSRMGSNSFSQYTFVNLTAIDILAKYPVQAEAWLRDVRPTWQGSIPKHPLDRCHDLYFLNTAEHFAIVLSPQCNEELLIGAANPYLGLASDPRLLEIFEAAHSTMLAVLSAPQNANLLARLIHRYVDALFGVFPQNLSPRQFRMAVKTLVRITSPPAPISQTQPLLPSVILELVRSRLESATPDLLQSAAEQSFPTEADNVVQEPDAISEQSAFFLTIIDSLPYLPLDHLEDWLPLTAESLTHVQDPVQLDTCRRRFWEILSNGEMDVARASLCSAWWGTRGGRELVMYGDAGEAKGPFMSGALVENGRL